MMAFVRFKGGRRRRKEVEGEWWEGRKERRAADWEVEVEVAGKRDADSVVKVSEYEI